jgi:hypothetical protein
VVFLIGESMVALVTLQGIMDNLTNQTASILPSVIAAIIVILVGVLIAWFVGKIVNKVVDSTVEKNFDKSEVGKIFRNSGFDLSNFVAGVIKAFIIVIAIVIAVSLLNVPGPAGNLLVDVAAYLPRILGAILVLVLGLVFVDFLASFIGKILKPMFPTKTEIADMLKNLLFIGLVAIIIFVAFDLLMFTAGGLVYSLILGFVIIGVGIILTDGLIKSITDEHKEFADIAGYAKFILYSVFLLVGIGAIFSSFSGVTGIISTIAWGFAIALAIVLIPIVYGLAKRMQSAK